MRKINQQGIWLFRASPAHSFEQVVSGSPSPAADLPWEAVGCPGGAWLLEYVAEHPETQAHSQSGQWPRAFIYKGRGPPTRAEPSSDLQMLQYTEAANPPPSLRVFLGETPGVAVEGQ